MAGGLPQAADEVEWEKEQEKVETMRKMARRMCLYSGTLKKTPRASETVALALASSCQSPMISGSWIPKRLHLSSFFLPSRQRSWAEARL